MAGQGLCCGSLEQPKALMKMGLSVILIGHVNFMLAALVQGVVLRHINFQKHHRALEYAISTVVVLTAGLVGIIVGILTIVLSKNKKSRALTWSVFVLSLTAALLAGLSAIGLVIAVAMAIKQNGRILLSHCRFPDAIGYSSVTNECPFDPTRIYSTTLVLWLPLIVTSVVQMVFCSRCFAVCLSFLGLNCCCCCPTQKRPRSFVRSSNVVKPLAAPLQPPFSPPHTSTLPQPTRPVPRPSSGTSSSHRSARSAPALVQYPQSPARPTHSRSHSSPSTRTNPKPQPQSAPRPPREESKPHAARSLPPSYASRHHYGSAPPSERHPVPKPHGQRPQREATSRAQQRLLEEYHLLNNKPAPTLQRGTMDRSSFWI